MTRQIANAQLAVPVNAQDHVRGLTTAAVTLIEYGDFQCPSCGEAFPIVEALLEQLGDRFRLVYHHDASSQDLWPRDRRALVRVGWAAGANAGSNTLIRSTTGRGAAIQGCSEPISYATPNVPARGSWHADTVLA